jgi:hypothetical protein
MMDLVLLLMNWMCAGFVVVSGLMAMMLSTKPEFISFLIHPKYHNLGFLILLFFFELYSVGVTVGVISFTSFYQAVYMILSYYWMGQIREDNLMTTDEKMKHFRTLQILNIYYNKSYTAESLVADLAIFFLVIIMTLFGAVRFHFITSFFEYMLFPFANFALLVVFTILMFGSAIVHSSSSKLVQSIKRNELFLEVSRLGLCRRRQLRQLKPFGVNIGAYGIVQKNSLLTVYGALSNYSASLLITFPHQYFSM